MKPEEILVEVDRRIEAAIAKAWEARDRTCPLCHGDTVHQDCIERCTKCGAEREVR